MTELMRLRSLTQTHCCPQCGGGLVTIMGRDRSADYLKCRGCGMIVEDPMPWSEWQKLQREAQVVMASRNRKPLAEPVAQSISDLFG